MKRRISVLTLTDNLNRVGGAERIAAYIALGLDRTRFQPFVCTTRPASGELLDQVYAAGIPLLRLERRRRLNVWDFAPLVRLLHRERIDVLHAHKFGSNLWGVLVGRFARVPVVVTHEHTWSYEGEPLRRLLDRDVIARGSDAFVAVSEEDRRRMIEIERVPPAKAVFVPNGIPQLAPPTGPSVRDELGIAPDVPVVGSLSTLRPQKRIDVLLRAVAILVRDHPEVRVLVTGQGADEEGLKSLAANLGLRETVLFVGTRSDVPEYLAALDIAINSSDYEGSPLSVMECMAAGKAIVATRVGGVPDLIDDGVHGLLVPAQDPVSLAAAVSRLIKSPDLCGRLGEEARARQQREFTVEAMVQRIEALYERKLEARGRR